MIDMGDYVYPVRDDVMVFVTLIRLLRSLVTL